MTDRPIIFSAPMIRALLSGKKTQTRRLKTSPLRHCKPGDRLWVRENWALHSRASDFCTIVYAASIEHAGWTEASAQLPSHLADGQKVRPFQDGWRPSIHMSRWMSRLTLIVTENRSQSLQDISEADAVAEGVEALDFEREDRDETVCPTCGGTRLRNWLGLNLGVIIDIDCTDCDTHKKRYQHLWDSLHGFPNDWVNNPALIALTFSVHMANIDAMPAQEGAAA